MAKVDDVATADDACASDAQPDIDEPLFAYDPAETYEEYTVGSAELDNGGESLYVIPLAKDGGKPPS